MHHSRPMQFTPVYHHVAILIINPLAEIKSANMLHHRMLLNNSSLTLILTLYRTIMILRVIILTLFNHMRTSNRFSPPSLVWTLHLAIPNCALELSTTFNFNKMRSDRIQNIFEIKARKDSSSEITQTLTRCL